MYPVARRIFVGFSDNRFATVSLLFVPCVVVVVVVVLCFQLAYDGYIMSIYCWPMLKGIAL